MKGPGVNPGNRQCGTAAEPAEIEMLYRTERASMVRYFARNSISAIDAEDLAQEAFLRLAGASQAGTRVTKPMGYLRQIGRNLLRDRARSAQHRLTVAAENPDALVSDQNELGRLEARDKLRRLEQAMHRLPLRSREIFLAHRLDGMSYVEIAEQTGLSVKRVEKIMSKTIGQLTRMLEQDS